MSSVFVVTSVYFTVSAGNIYKIRFFSFIKTLISTFFSDDFVFQLSAFQRVKIYVPRMLMMLVLITYSEPMEQDLDKQPDAASRTAVHWHLCRNIIVSCTIPAADRLVDVNIYQVVVHRVVLILPSET